jgi:hypothetical protein
MIKKFSQFFERKDTPKPKGAPDWHDSDAPDAEGRFRDLSIKDLAAWLIKTRKGDVRRISGSLTQQIVFNRKEDPKYAEKMEKTRKEVYKQLGREDLLESEIVTEGVYDKNILKAFFMAGGPGSGKSYVAGELFGFPYGSIQSVSYSTGLKTINSDTTFELELKKLGIDPKDLASLDKEEFEKLTLGPDSLRSKAKKITQTRKNLFQEGRLGLVLDGTGDDYEKIKKKREELESLGYDTYMIFVNTSLPVAIERNAQRSRSLPVNFVEESWKAVQENLGKFQRLFSNMVIIDNTEADQNVLREAEKVITKLLQKPLKNPIGKKWMQQMKNENQFKKFEDFVFEQEINEIGLASVGAKDALRDMRDDPDLLDYLGFGSLRNAIRYIKDASIEIWAELSQEIQDYKDMKKK